MLLCALTSSSLLAQQLNKPAKETIEDESVVYPESMTENLSQLLHDWQIDLKNSKSDCNRGRNVVFNDSVYAKRLNAIPAVMELSFNQVVKKYIDTYTDRRRDQVSYMLALGNHYFPMFEQMLDKYDLPLELKYLPVIESALNPVAVSRAGATGLWQFMLPTGQGYGLEVNSLVDERRDPYKSTEAAVKYLRDLYSIYQDWNLVIAAYNCGPGNVNKAIARSGGKKDYWEIYYSLPRETRGYVPAFIAVNYVMNHYNDHNICPAETYGTLTGLDTVYVYKEMHIDQIAKVLDVSSSELKRLNPQFKKDIIPGNSKPYALVLPTNKMLAFIDQQDAIANYRRETYFADRINTDSYLQAAPTVAPSESKTQNVYYRVKRGDNLSKIASKNGVSVNQIKKWNGLKSTKISIGKSLIVKKRTITVPKTEVQETPLLAQKNEDRGKVSVKNEKTQTANFETQNKYYKVRKGDTLDAIARKNGVTVSQLRAWNGLKSTRISAGKSLIVNQSKVAVSQTEDELLAENTDEISSAKEEPQTTTYKTKNKYYKVRKGDTLGAIAQKNRVTVSQLRAWNGLKSTKISVGKNLVVKKTKVAIMPPPLQNETKYNKSESSEPSNSVISDYLKKQIESGEEQKSEQGEPSIQQTVLR